MNRLLCMIGLMGSVFCSAGVAHADEDIGLRKQYSNCMNKSNGVTIEMIDCITEEMKHQDGRLNKAYKEAMAPLSSARRKELQEVQRAWIKFRDAKCYFFNEPDGGTAVRVIVNDCLMSTTATRAKELETMK